MVEYFLLSQRLLHSKHSKKNIKENNFNDIVIAEDTAVSNVSGVAHFKVTEGSEMNSVTDSNDESTISVKKSA